MIKKEIKESESASIRIFYQQQRYVVESASKSYIANTDFKDSQALLTLKISTIQVS